MEVILLDSVPNLGDRGATVKVKPGYARNYLFPRKLALPFTEGSRRVVEERERLIEKRDQLAMDVARKDAAKMADVSCTIPVQVGEEDKLYGSVTAADIARSLAEQGHSIDKRQIGLEEPIVVSSWSQRSSSASSKPTSCSAIPTSISRSRSSSLAYTRLTSSSTARCPCPSRCGWSRSSRSRKGVTSC